MISAASSDRDGVLLATSSRDHSVRLWDFESRKLQRTLFGHRGEVWSVALTPSGDLVASGSKDGEVKIWPTEPGARSDAIEGSWKHLGFSADGNYLAASDREGLLSIFNLRSGEAIHTMGLTPSASRSPWRSTVSMSGDLSVLVEALEGGIVKVRNLEKETELSFQATRRQPGFVALSPSADTVVTIARGA
ncbi:MAG: hypothetical protein GWO24_31240, partial [Akkermansiaceae bacterium]|nr:hypothetical protein [Akkermansiaceae bacterium]